MKNKNIEVLDQKDHCFNIKLIQERQIELGALQDIDCEVVDTKIAEQMKMQTDLVLVDKIIKSLFKYEDYE